MKHFVAYAPTVVVGGIAVAGCVAHWLAIAVPGAIITAVMIMAGGFPGRRLLSLPRRGNDHGSINFAGLFIWLGTVAVLTLAMLYGSAKLVLGILTVSVLAVLVRRLGRRVSPVAASTAPDDQSSWDDDARDETFRQYSVHLGKSGDPDTALLTTIFGPDHGIQDVNLVAETIRAACDADAQRDETTTEVNA